MMREAGFKMHQEYDFGERVWRYEIRVGNVVLDTVGETQEQATGRVLAVIVSYLGAFASQLPTETPDRELDS